MKAKSMVETGIIELCIARRIEIRKQGTKAYTGNTDPVVAKEWLRSTERILDQFECTFKKKVSYTVSLFE